MSGRLRTPGVLSFLRWEWTLQARTLRFRLGVVVYLAVVSLPALVLYLGGERIFGARPGPVSFLVWTQLIAVLASHVLACVVAGHRAGLRDREEMWPVLQASPLSNAGYALRRSLAVALLLAPVTLLGLALAASVAAAAGEIPTSPTRWLLTWLLVIYLPAAATALAWRTLVSASGSEMVAAVVALVLLKSTGPLSAWTHRAFGHRLGVDGEFFGFSGFQWATFLLGRLDSNRSAWAGGVASEAPFPPSTALVAWWLAFGVTLALLLAVGLLVPLWLGRTRRDLPPLRLGDEHWLRSLGPKVYGFLQRLVPDAGLRELRWLLPLVLVVVALPLADQVRRGQWALDLAERRFRAEQAGAVLPVTDAGVRLTRWRSEGELTPHGADLRWLAEMTLEGPEVLEGLERKDETDRLRLAFTVQPFLRVEEVEVERLDTQEAHDAQAALRVVRTRRVWDRWWLDLAPRPRPGERFRLRAALRGAAGDVDFALDGRRTRNASFSSRFDGYRRRTSVFAGSDLADSRFVRAFDARRMRLGGADLGPVLRTTSWELTPKPVIPGERGWEVPPEESSAAAQVELDLTFHLRASLDDRLGLARGGGGLEDREGLGLSVASSCGGWSEPAPPGAPVRLVDSCRQPPHEVAVRGGRWRRLGTPPVVAAALPRHAERLDDLLPDVRRAVGASAEAWPGFPGIDRLVVVEMPYGYDLGGLGLFLRAWDPGRPGTVGRMVEFRETQLLGDGLLDASAVLDGVLGGELVSARRVAPEQALLLRSFLASLMKRRMGLEPGRAVLGQGLPAWKTPQLSRPLLELSAFHDAALAHKVPAVLLQLERRLGMEHLVAGVSEFLAPDTQARETQDPATVEELFEVLEERTGEDLDRFFADYFTGGALPELALVDVRSRPLRGGFRITGAVQNAADGEVHCPVVLRTQGPELRRTVVVPAEGRVDFAFDVDVRPQMVLLDPDGVCLRRFGGGGTGGERVPL